MMRSLRACPYLWVVLLLSVGVYRGDCSRGFCVCTSSSCGQSSKLCELTEGKTCYRVAVQVDDRDNIDTRGCVNGSLDSSVEHSLTIVVIQRDLVYVAISQCNGRRCNDYTNPAGRWLKVGVNQNCSFPRGFSEIVVQWSSNGTVMTNISSLCPYCDNIRQPGLNETLCDWYANVTAGNKTIIPSVTPVEPAVPSATHLYISAGVAAAIVLVGVVFGFTEHANAKRVKRAKGSAPKKKGAKERVMMTTLLPPPKSALPVVKEVAPGTKQQTAAAKEPASGTKEPVAPAKEPAKQPVVSAKEKVKSSVDGKGTASGSKSASGGSAGKGKSANPSSKEKTISK